MSLPKQALIDQAKAVYQNAPPVQLKRISYLKKLSNERKLKRMAEKLQADLAETEKQEKELVVAFIAEIDDQRLLFEHPFLRFFLNQGYLDVAEQFLDRAKEQDGELKTWEVYQAMRNVWIMNSLQLYWELPLEMTPAVYAYSLLYPYTDNYLDDPEVSQADKFAFNEQLSRAIQGEPINGNRIFELLQTIEGQFPRLEFPEVFESIQFIHKAQIDSLQQHRSLTEEEIFHVSLAKGGSSVLADAFLVKGNLTAEEMQFSFQYGAFLQLLDDLQDCKEDRNEGHLTLYSAKEGQLDKEVQQLLAFIHESNRPEEKVLMKDVIRSCTIMMVMEAISRQPELVSRSLYRQLEAASPVRLAFYPEMMAFFQSMTVEVPFDESFGQLKKTGLLSRLSD